MRKPARDRLAVGSPGTQTLDPPGTAENATSIFHAIARLDGEPGSTGTRQITR
ncbi:MAG: hypothetical protein PVG54_10200 [Anaerolineae bacterium]